MISSLMSQAALPPSFSVVLSFHLLLLMTRLDTSLGMGINNFKFIGGNKIRGSHVPQNIRISGTYYANPEDTAWTAAPQFTGNQFNIANLAGDGPWICSNAEMVMNISIQFNKTMIDIVANNLKNIPALNSSAEATWKGFIDRGVVRPPIDVSSCTAVALAPITGTPYPHINGNAWSFDLTVLATAYGPILFIDYFGVSAFHYENNPAVDESVGDNVLRYCDRPSQQSYTYTFNRRPECPNEGMIDNRRHTAARITIYKPNIVSVSHDIVKCQYTNTFIYGSKSFWGSRHDNRPLVAKNFGRPTFSECKDMAADKNSKYGKLTKGKAPGTYATFNDKPVRHPWCGSYKRNVKDAVMIESTMEISMPSLRVSTPWQKIPASALSKLHHSDYHDGILIWNKFEPKEVCTYVPRFSATVDVVTYPDESRVNGGLIYFVSDSLKSVLSVSNASEITHVKGDYTCILMAENDRLFTNGENEIIHMQPIKKKLVGLSSLGHDAFYHAQDSYSKITASTDGRVTDIQRKKRPGSRHLVGLPNPFANTVKKKDAAPSETELDRPSLVTPTEGIEYAIYKNEELANRNAHVRAMNDCSRDQLAHDTTVQLSLLDPSTALSKHLQRPVKAVISGNGFYSVHECELVIVDQVYPHLNTAAEYVMRYQSDSKPWSDFLRDQFGITTDPRKCLSFPLIRFHLTVNDVVQIGQLTPNGILNTKKVVHYEECDLGREHSFLIDHEIYYFTNYVLSGKFPEERLYGSDSIKLTQSTNRVLVNINDTSGHDGAEGYNIIVVNPTAHRFAEKKYTHIPVGLITNDLYSLFERQSAVNHLTSLIDEVSENKFRTQTLSENITADAAGPDAWRDSPLGGLGGIIKSLADGGASVFEGLGKGIGSAAKGIGTGGGKIIDSTSKASSNLLDSLSSALSSTILPILGILAGVLLAGIVVFVIVKKFVLDDDSNGGGRYSRLDSEDDDEYVDDDDDDDEIDDDGKDNVLFDKTSMGGGAVRRPRGGGRRRSGMKSRSRGGNPGGGISSMMTPDNRSQLINAAAPLVIGATGGTAAAPLVAGKAMGLF